MPAFVTYGHAGEALARGEWHWTASDMRLWLVGQGYTPDLVVHSSVSDLSDLVPTTGDYPASGRRLRGRTAVYAAGVTRLGAKTLVMSGLTCAFRYAVVADKAGPLVAVIDWGDQEAVGATLTQEFDLGIIEIVGGS